MIKFEDIRNNFINFFKKNNHHFVTSSSLVPNNDPTLLFTNAGMVQFKDLFTGKDQPKYENIVTSQKCIRAGGKHNDLDNVGYTPRHHTFFEMLGNFSFGSYFKEEAIYYAWNFLTKICSIDPNKLIVTVYKGDEESLKMWKKISGISNSKIIEISTYDNFWSMGESGPCGPCSEIFYDNGKDVSGGLPGSKNQDGERYVEIWNLVFMEYEKNNEKLSPLPNKCVDTGMGLERISAVLNGKINNFEVDIFQDLINEISKLTKINVTNNNVVSFRVISDHIRSIVFLIAEGILPANEGRGYVLRRIIRRASRHLSLIGFHHPILFKLVKTVCMRYENFYFDLKPQKSFIIKTLELEENKFIDTLKEGLKILNLELKKIKGNKFPSEIAFKLYDTYGFPIDMTQSILNEVKLSLNLQEINSLINNQKNRSRKSWKGSGELEKNKVLGNLKIKLSSTNFTGYKNKIESSELLEIINNENLGHNHSILIFNKTPFYAESGGQIGDFGTILDINDNEITKIFDTKKEGSVHLHFVKNINKNLIVGKEYKLVVNEDNREKVTKNHSATHLLHESLRMVLGKHVKQKGSLVSSNKLRFDFTNNDSVNTTKIQEIEKIINKVIRQNLRVTTTIMSHKKAIESGAIGLFGEKYPENVRVVSMKSEHKNNFFSSSELCGGTHVTSTGEIGSMRILSETSVSSGVRRIEAVTGEDADKFSNNKSFLLDEIKMLLKANETNLVSKIKNLINENQKLTKLVNSNDKNLNFEKKYLTNIKNIPVYIQRLKANSKELKNYADKIKKELNSCVIILISNTGDKISIVVSVSKNLIPSLSAKKIVNSISLFLDGSGGGGRDDLAQGGGNNISKLEGIKTFIEKLI